MQYNEYNNINNKDDLDQRLMSEIHTVVVLAYVITTKQLLSLLAR